MDYTTIFTNYNNPTIKNSFIDTVRPTKLPCSRSCMPTSKFVISLSISFLFLHSSECLSISIPICHYSTDPLSPDCPPTPPLRHRHVTSPSYRVTFYPAAPTPLPTYLHGHTLSLYSCTPIILATPLSQAPTSLPFCAAITTPSITNTNNETKLHSRSIFYIRIDEINEAPIHEGAQSILFHHSTSYRDLNEHELNVFQWSRIISI